MRAVQYDVTVKQSQQTTSMGSGRGGWGKWKLGNVQAYRQKTGFGNQRGHFAGGSNSRHRRAGQRFHYRRRPRRRKLLPTVWKEFRPFNTLMACSLLFPVICQVLSLVATPANALDAGLLSRIVFINAFRYMFISRYVTSDGAPHHGVLAATPATSGSMCANATRFIHIWMASVQVGLRVQRTSVFMKLSLLLHALYHLPALSAIYAYCGLRIPVTASPISRNRQCTPLNRTASGRSPAYERPAITSNCRIHRQDGSTWARSLLDHTASYLYAWAPRHAASLGTLHTLRNFRKLLQKKEVKKIEASRSNNVFQKLERPAGSWSVRHSSETFVASPKVYALLFTWPLLIQIAATSTATPALQPTWGLPATLLADLVGVWFDACIQRMRDRHGTHSTPEVQLMDTPASAVSQTPELGSGVGDASRTGTHSRQLIPLQHQGRRAAHIMASDGT